MPAPVIDQALQLAKEHHLAGRVVQAEGLYRQVLGQFPNHPQALFMLGTLVVETGRLDEAAELFRQAVRHESTGVWIHLALGSLERARGNPGVAIDWFRRAVELRPDTWETHGNLGLALLEAGRPGDAFPELCEALRLDPNRAELHYNAGVSLGALGRPEEAAAAYGRATELNPDFAEAYNNLGLVWKALTRLDEANAAFQRALEIRPDWVAALGNIAGVYEWQARHDEALACHRRAMALAPGDAVVHGSCLYSLLFHPRYDAEALRGEHADWNRRHAEPLKRHTQPHENDRDPGRRLRVGYVCGLLRNHVLARYLMPLLREHDRTSVEVFCYSNNQINDEVTERFRQMAAGWRAIEAMPDEQAAALIRQDRIDVLVDTTLHMEGGRLLLFARKPAPVQVTFAGYPGSTGLEAIDYRLTDVHLDPPGLHDRWYAEKSWRLPETFWCYDSLGEDTAPGPLPALANGAITFGCMNNFSKVNDQLLGLWAMVLRTVVGSRLLLLCHEGSHRGRMLGMLKGLGIEPERVEFVGYRPRSSYLELFQRIDISLDTVPYNGHTTSLDSLWMGVPVVTLTGNTVVGRAGLSQLTNLGLRELVARTPEEYLSIASDLAADLGRLQELRRTLRERMARSPLMDAKRFARHVEAAYREMWQRWRAAREGDPITTPRARS